MTAAFNYRDDPRLMAEFLWWFNHLSAMKQGHDKSIEVANLLPKVDGWMREKLGICYDSFLFLHHSSFDSLPYLRTVLRNALRLNTASLLHAVHGSLIPFLPSIYGRPFLTRVYLNAVSSLLSHCPSIPLISTLVYTLRTLLGPCTGSPRI